MKRKIAVFGATGEIGGRIAFLAAAAGHDVTGITRGKRTFEWDPAGIKFITGDKNDPAFLAQLAAENDFDAIIDSVPGYDTVDRYAQAFPKAENVFFCGSVGTYMPLQYFPADEKHPWREKTRYNFYEQCVRDAHALDMCAAGKLPVTIFRPTNIIGAGRVPLELWGARDIEFFRKLKAGEPITIAPCEEIMVQSGFNWDLASAFVAALDHPDKVRGEIFNISCKKAITLGEYLRTAMEYLNSTSEISHVPAERLADIYPQVTMHYRMEFLLCHMNFDISKAEDTFGYAPKKTTQEGLITALQWCEESGLL